LHFFNYIEKKSLARKILNLGRQGAGKMFKAMMKDYLKKKIILIRQPLCHLELWDRSMLRSIFG
jgi:hypothetical protein